MCYQSFVAYVERKFWRHCRCLGNERNEVFSSLLHSLLYSGDIGTFNTYGLSQGVGFPASSRMLLLLQSSSLLYQDSHTSFISSASLTGRPTSLLDAHMLSVLLYLPYRVDASRSVT